MPCLEIYLPETNRETKSRLADRLTALFAECSGFPAEIFAIHFNEYQPDQIAIAGKLWDGQTGRPYLHMVLYIPRIKRSVKQKLVAEFSTAFAECVNHPDWKPVIHICEHPYDNVGVEGQLLSDAYEACANKSFYYDMNQPED